MFKRKVSKFFNGGSYLKRTWACQMWKIVYISYVNSIYKLQKYIFVRTENGIFPTALFKKASNQLIQNSNQQSLIIGFE